MSITIILILITSAISYLAFQSPVFMAQTQLNPYMIIHRGQWYRVMSHAFVHANYTHLLINLFVLYSFGLAAEQYLNSLRYYRYLEHPVIHYLILYIGGIIFSVLTTLIRHRNNPVYNAVGASGAVSAIVFITFFFEPWEKIYLFAIIPVPGILFGILYLGYSHFMSRRDADNINHDAHFAGAIFGFLYPVTINPRLIQEFIQKLLMH